METKIKKNQTANVGKYSYKYVDIAQIHEYLEANKMSYYQYIDRIDGDDYIMTVKIIDGKEYPALRGCRVVDATLVGVTNPAQQQGSALTYARRYSLLMAFGLATEDDDAQSLSAPIEVTKEDAENYVLSFGKHKGKKLSELDKGYIDWLLNNSKDERLIKMVELATGKKKLTEEEHKEMFLKLSELDDLLMEKDIDREQMYKHYGVTSNSDMTLEQLEDAIAKIKGE